MKNVQQNLLIILALCLCGLCAYQWYGQTLQGEQIEKLNQFVYDKNVAIRNYTNSIATLNHQIAEMDANLTRLRNTAKTNAQTIDSQKLDIARLRTINAGLTNQVAQYKEAVGTMTAKLKEAYDGIKKQNAALKELVAQRDEFVKKYNDSINDRNNIVSKYNELAGQVRKMQGQSSR
jgi:chromosome segregation ATPase